MCLMNQSINQSASLYPPPFYRVCDSWFSTDYQKILYLTLGINHDGSPEAANPGFKTAGTVNVNVVAAIMMGMNLKTEQNPNPKAKSSEADG